MKYSDIKKDENGGFRIGPISEVPDISQTPQTDVASLFLGPHAENHELLTSLIEKALSHIYEYRRHYSSGDPVVITEEIKNSTSYRQAGQHIQVAFDELLDFLLKHATPYFSLRYQGHMLWDNTLPAIAAYFATMLHNPNNVTLQASTSTTPLAMLVGWDMCRMVGFVMNEQIEPWSHLTADGTVANIESLWTSRELQFLPLALREFLLDEKEIRCLSAREIMVNCCDGRRCKLLEADVWELINLDTDETLSLPQRVADLCDIDDVFEVWNILINYSCNNLGSSYYIEQLKHHQIRAPAIITPSTKHYSWPKAAAICGYGVKAIRNIYVDADARMEISELQSTLDDCVENKIPIAMLVVVCGSTEESAVDNIQAVLKLRSDYRKRGLNFRIHVDAAWGGYMLSIIRLPYKLLSSKDSNSNFDIFVDDVSRIPASDYVIEQLKHIHKCDSVTIDPHKWGYVQYPAGAVLYRNGEARRLTTFTSAYIGNDSSIKPDGPNVGIFGLEGSRAGAAAAAVYLSHRCLRPTIDGYGKIISECLFNTRMFYVRLLELNREALNFVVMPLVRLPAEVTGSDVEAQRADISRIIFLQSTEQIRSNPEAWHLLREIGPDQNILDYGFNFRLPGGSINTNAELYNRLNELIYDKFSMHFDKPDSNKQTPLIVSKTTFYRHEYGDVFIDNFAQRLGLKNEIDKLACLRSVVMDPYVTQTADGSYFVEIIRQIRDYVSDTVASEFLC